jgi:hypothetical protein
MRCGHGYCDVSLGIALAMVYYCAAGYTWAEAIMVAVPEMM